MILSEQPCFWFIYSNFAQFSDTPQLNGIFYDSIAQILLAFSTLQKP